MAKVPKDFLKATEDLYIKKPRMIKAGGVVSLKSYWAATGQDLWKKVDGRFAKVEARETENGDIYLVIVLPFKDGTTKELRTWPYQLDEGDEVDITSIVMLFIDNDRGGTDVYYDAFWDGDHVRCKEEDIKCFIVDKCSELMKSIKPSKPIVVKKIKVVFVIYTMKSLMEIPHKKIIDMQ